jgi:RHS repeat-associated protein
LNSGASLFYEDESGVAGMKKRHYLNAGNETFGMIVCTASPCTSTANTSTQYWYQDHLGSNSVTADASGAVIERLAYEPFGKRRLNNGNTDTLGTLVATSTDRGFTGHEHMQEVGLINMNGRIYDPGLARFMSADTTIQSPASMQSYNRYSYLWNNPLNGTDPTGYVAEGADFGSSSFDSATDSWGTSTADYSFGGMGQVGFGYGRGAASSPWGASNSSLSLAAGFGESGPQFSFSMFRLIGLPASVGPGVGWLSTIKDYAGTGNINYTFVRRGPAEGRGRQLRGSRDMVDRRRFLLVQLRRGNWYGRAGPNHRSRSVQP